jgi:hypothetical protein
MCAKESEFVQLPCMNILVNYLLCLCQSEAHSEFWSFY